MNNIPIIIHNPIFQDFLLKTTLNSISYGKKKCKKGVVVPVQWAVKTPSIFLVFQVANRRLFGQVVFSLFQTGQ
jgi:hypothetical protein